MSSLTSTPVKARWKPEKIENPFINREIEQELEDVRQSRPQTLQKVYNNCLLEQTL